MAKTQNLSNVRGVLFDVDGTLYSQFPLRAIMAALLLLSNLLRPHELARKARVIDAYRKAQEAIRFSSEKIASGPRKQIELASEKTGESLDYVLETVSEWFDKRPLPYLRIFRRKGIKKAIICLQKKGVRLGAYSDYPVEDKLRALGISEYISTVVSAADPMVRGFKPRTNGFDVAAQKMGLQPSEIVYIGDRANVDGVGASTAGMQVMIFEGLQIRKKNSHFPSFSSFKGLMRMLAGPT